MDINRQKYAVALLSVVSNTVLVILKLAIGLAMGSISVVSEAIHSGVDVLAAIVAVVGVKRSCEPADERHSFGHGKFENVSGLIQAFFIFLAAAWILRESVQKLITPYAIDSVGLGIAVMIVSSIVNAIVARQLFKVGNKTDSIALKADAWHCLTDVYTSVGIMVGLAAIWAGSVWLPGVNMRWVDPTAAIVVALFIIKAAFDLTLESLGDLLDVSLPADEEEYIKGILKEKYPSLMGFHNLRTRKAGAVRFVEFHILVDPKMQVDVSHELQHSIARQVKSRFPGTEIMIHIEPCDRSCRPKCRKNCFALQFQE